MTKHRSLSDSRNCTACSKPLVTRFQVKFCSPTCASVVRRKPVRVHGKRATAVIEDVQWIIGTDTPESIARRVGYAHLSSLTRSLEHWGEHDLAMRLREIKERTDEWSATA